jgi:hypothetical protein
MEIIISSGLVKKIRILKKATILVFFKNLKELAIFMKELRVIKAVV